MTKNLYLSNFLTMYFSAAVSMLIIFVMTMMVHYQSIDYRYLCYALVHILWLAIPSGILGILMNKKHLLIKLFIGIVTGPTTAFLFIYL